MTAVAILSRIGELERELSFLKNQVRVLVPEAQSKTFGDLYGIWEGKVNLSGEEIDEAKLTFNWDKWDALHSEENS